MTLQTSPLRDVHATNGADFTDFGGWEMPVSFAGISDEHRAVREAVGRFDVSHMGEIVLTGPDATALLQRITTNDVRIADGGPNLLYSMLTNETGIILDDVMLYCLPETFDGDWLFVPNAGHGEWITEWTRGHRDDLDLDVTVENRTDEYAMFAIQGPAATRVVAEAAGAPVSSLGHLEMLVGDVAGVECLLSTSGYTGEDGLEVLCPWTAAETVWSSLECQDCGLGARDTLRLEMGYLLSGNEFDNDANPRTPYETGWGRYVVKLDTPFIGRDGLEGVFENGVEERLIGLELIERGVPRTGYPILTPSGATVGEVTSGTMSPTLDTGIALGYVESEYATEGKRLAVEIRGDPKAADTVRPPFVER